MAGNLRLVATFFVPGKPIPQGGQKMAPSGPPIAFDRLRNMTGGFILGTHRKIGKCGWRAKNQWSNKEELEPWRAKIAHCARSAYTGPQLDGDLGIGAVFTFQRNKGHYLRGALRALAPLFKNTSPDLDKLLRAVFDALEINAKLITNDARFVKLVGQTSKQYGNHPGAQISIYAPENE